MAEVGKRVSLDLSKGRPASLRSGESGEPPVKGERGFDPEEDFEMQEDEEEVVAAGKDWRTQLTMRCVLVGIATGFLITFISMTIGLSGAGVSPGYSVTASLIGYAIMKPTTGILIKYYTNVVPFKKQEVCLIQAIATSIQSLVHALGVSSWLWGLHENVAAQLDEKIEVYEDFLEWKAAGNETKGTIPLDMGNMILIAFLIAFTGVLIVTVFRKMFIVELKLPFPSPTATAVMINSFFTESGRDLADKQLKSFIKWATITFSVGGINYLFTRDSCPAFNRIPIFGKYGYKQGWVLNLGSYLNFLGVGMIMPANISYSLVLGALLAFAAVYPALWENGAMPDADGNLPADAWFDQSKAADMSGFYGYKIMFTLMILLGDGVFALLLMCYIGYTEWKKRRAGVTDEEHEERIKNETAHEREHRIHARIFCEDGVDNRWIVGAYVFITVLGAICIPLLYDATWFMVIVAFMLTPIFSLIGNYIAGLTDWNVTSNFAKAAAILFGAWGQAYDPENAITISLICCGIVYCGASNSTDIIGDFKTGYLTRTSPFAMLIVQIIGFGLGCIFTPVVFYMFVESEPATGFPIPQSKYPNTYGSIYRAMASLAVNGGFDGLPKNCMLISMILFAISLVLPALKLVVLGKLEGRFPRAYFWVELLWPSPMAVGIPFLVGTDFVVPVGIGLAINELWKWSNPKENEDYYQVVAAAILVGPGLWSIPEVVLTLIGVRPPLCMTYERDLEIMAPNPNRYYLYPMPSSDF